jgi:hypothetical protein
MTTTEVLATALVVFVLATVTLAVILVRQTARLSQLRTRLIAAEISAQKRWLRINQQGRTIGEQAAMIAEFADGEPSVDEDVARAYVTWKDGSR